MFLFWFIQAWLIVAIGAQIAAMVGSLAFIVVCWCNHFDRKGDSNEWPIWPIIVAAVVFVIAIPSAIGGIAVTANFIGERNDAHHCADDPGPPYCKTEAPG